MTLTPSTSLFFRLDSEWLDRGSEPGIRVMGAEDIIGDTNRAPTS